MWKRVRVNSRARILSRVLHQYNTYVCVAFCTWLSCQIGQHLHLINILYALFLLLYSSPFLHSSSNVSFALSSSLHFICCVDKKTGDSFALWEDSSCMMNWQGYIYTAWVDHELRSVCRVFKCREKNKVISRLMHNSSSYTDDVCQGA